jgi:hypothetical protein
MKELNNKEIKLISGGFSINDLNFKVFVDIVANCALTLGIVMGKIILIPYDATRGIVDGAKWGISGCKEDSQN